MNTRIYEPIALGSTIFRVSFALMTERKFSLPLTSLVINSMSLQVQRSYVNYSTCVNICKGREPRYEARKESLFHYIQLHYNQSVDVWV